MSDNYGKAALEQLADMSQDITELQNTGVDTTARADITKMKALNHRKDYELNSGYVIADFSDFANWNNTMAANGNLSEDKTFAKSGGSALRLNVTSAGAYVQADKQITFNVSATNKNLSLWVYFQDPIANYSLISIMLYNAFTGTYFARYINPERKHQGWNHLLISASEWQVGGGSPNWNNNIVAIRVRVTASTGKTCSLTVSDMRIGVSYLPRIIFRIDDGHKSFFELAYPILIAKGIKGIVYAVPDYADAGVAYSPVSDLTTMYNAGWDIGNHTKSHANFDNTTFAETYAAIKDGQDWLFTNGFYRSARHFCVPSGADSEKVQAALDAAAVLTSTNSVHDMVLPTMDIHQIPSEAIYNTTTLATITGWIDNCVSSGRTLILQFHYFVADTADEQYECLTSTLQGIVDYLDTNNLLQYVTTMSDYYIGLNRAA